MRFSELLKKAGLDAAPHGGDAEVVDVQADSRKCTPGSCFVAVRGVEQDGRRYIPAAVEAGASAIVCEGEPPAGVNVPVAVVDSTRRAAGRLAQAVHGFPARKLTTVAVTGTNGKTTVTCLTRAMLERAGVSAALLGTIRYDTGGRSLPAATTTPDPVTLAELTEEMVRGGRTHLVMEASSHALHQDRIAGLGVRVAVFTNLSGDHLDYHGTQEEYLVAKRRLFEPLDERCVAVINRDDPAGEVFAAAAAPAKVLWYGLSSAADLWARIDRIDATGTRFVLMHGGQEVPVRTTLIGRHNVFNVLAAAGACLSLGVDLSTVAAALSETECVPGRLQRVDADAPFDVFVDYAHTDDALANVLGALQPITRGRLIVVFGCGGDRDRTKRPRMAAVAERFADRIIVTSDNPRSEEPDAIIEDVLAGFSQVGRVKVDVQPDRRAAIRQAVGEARDGDVVLVAGKGHENYQVLGERRVHFDDVEEAAAAVARQEATS